jgi:hypothetical protein
LSNGRRIGTFSGSRSAATTRCEFYLGLSEAGRRKSFKDLKFYKRRKRWVF